MQHTLEAGFPAMKMVSRDKSQKKRTKQNDNNGNWQNTKGYGKTADISVETYVKRCDLMNFWWLLI